MSGRGDFRSCGEKVLVLVADVVVAEIPYLDTFGLAWRLNRALEEARSAWWTPEKHAAATADKIAELRAEADRLAATIADDRPTRP